MGKDKQVGWERTCRPFCKGQQAKERDDAFVANEKDQHRQLYAMQCGHCGDDIKIYARKG